MLKFIKEFFQVMGEMAQDYQAQMRAEKEHYHNWK